MKALNRLMELRLGTERLDLRLAQGACFAAGPAVLVVALYGLARIAMTPGEVFTGVLSASALAVGLVTMGMVMGLMADLRSH